MQLNDDLTLKKVLLDSDLFTLLRVYNSKLMSTCCFLWLKLERRIINKADLRKYLTSWIPATQSPYILQLYYVDQVQGDKLGFVCEDPGEEICLLRGKN